MCEETEDLEQLIQLSIESKTGSVCCYTTWTFLAPGLETKYSLTVSVRYS